MGAHLHRFIEWVHWKVSACSGGASSTNLLGRCRLYERIETVLRGGAKEGQVGGAAGNWHILRAP